MAVFAACTADPDTTAHSADQRLDRVQANTAPRVFINSGVGGEARFEDQQCQLARREFFCRLGR